MTCTNAENAAVLPATGSKSYPAQHRAGWHGPVLSTETSWTPHGKTLAALQAHRADLLAMAAKQRNLRQSKAASLTEAELRAVTNEIMKRELTHGG